MCNADRSLVHYPGNKCTGNSADRKSAGYPLTFLVDKMTKYRSSDLFIVRTMKISARNQIPGTVKKIKKGPVSTEVVITIAGAHEIVSSITTHSAESLKLKEGSKVYAVVKASEVMVGID
jgi:molybdopterin-binding protein